jgi:predicted nucleic acid-binding protein
MKIYLDNCCLNRPFDNQLDIKIRLETEAKLYIQYLIQKKKLQIVWSYILDFENSKNPFEERKQQIERWKIFAVEDIEENDTILKIGLKKIDALHIACAIYAKCNYFITTDKGILKKAKRIKELIVIDPINFINEVLDAY